MSSSLSYWLVSTMMPLILNECRLILLVMSELLEIFMFITGIRLHVLV